MALLNRPHGSGPIYDENGRLTGGLSALEELARVISIGNGENRTSEEANGDAEEMVEAKELPIHSVSCLSTRSTDSSSLASDSDSELSDHSSDDALEDISVLEHPDPSFPVRSSAREQPLPISDSTLLLTSSPSTSYTTDCPPNMQSRERSSSESRDKSATMPVGDSLKQYFLNLNVVGTLLVRKCSSLYFSISNALAGFFLSISLEQFSTRDCLRSCAPNPDRSRRRGFK
jgi:hypothetical protein